ncbi:MAG TPA: pyroglutamyl-peptidase I, partial [Stellaceae bacterium]|nr:pyroglutamyl-peptidase I [Stellaceae bacterium]
DNAGNEPIDRPVVAGGPAAYFATLPLKPAVAALMREGLPAAVSNRAGTFVCNHVFYSLMHRAAARPPRLGAGLLHVPYLPAQAAAHPGAPSMALDDVLRAIEIVLRVAANAGDDPSPAAGG